METIITVDGFETTLTEFVNINMFETGVDHISIDDLERINNTRIGYALHLGIVKIVIERVEYRGYTIENANCPYAYALHFYETACGIDGDKATPIASSLEDAKRQIDDEIFERTSYKVQTATGITKFDWLTDALQYVYKFNGHLLNSFDAI